MEKQQLRQLQHNMNRRESRQNRKLRSKSKIRGNVDRPRLTVFRSNKHIFAQIIDDESGKTLAAASSLKMKNAGKKVDMAEKIGEEIAKAAKHKKITKVVLDRSGYKYHGRVKSLADGARKGGLQF